MNAAQVSVSDPGQPVAYLSDLDLLGLAGKIMPSKRESLGLVLGFTKVDLAFHAAKNPKQDKLQIHDMLIDWRNRQEGDGPTNVKLLGQALAHSAVGLGDLKKELYKYYHITE